MSETLPHLSFSKLTLFAKDINLFRAKYISKTLKSRDSDSLNLGSLIDVILFTPEKFNVLYEIGKAPKISGLMGKFIESYARQMAIQTVMIPYQLSIIREDDIDIMRSAYKEAEYKLDFNVVTKQFIENQEYQRYYKYLLSCYTTDTTKQFVDEETYELAKNICAAIQTNPFTKDWYKTKGEYQFEIKWYHPMSKDIIFLSFLDKLTIDDENEVIYIDDLKSTEKRLINFHESIEEYRYDWQATLYRSAVKYLIETGVLKDYRIVSRIIGVETYYPYRSLIYEFSEKTLYDATLELNKLISDLLWHLDTNIWDFPKYVYDKNGIIKY